VVYFRKNNITLQKGVVLLVIPLFSFEKFNQFRA
jgi:hypothetical protein